MLAAIFCLFIVVGLLFSVDFGCWGFDCCLFGLIAPGWDVWVLLVFGLEVVLVC